MTYEEYARENVEKMRSAAPSGQNMRDLALLELWIESKKPAAAIEKEVIAESATTETETELHDVFPALKKYQADHTLACFQNLCVEVREFLTALYASTRNDEERAVYNSILKK